MSHFEQLRQGLELESAAAAAKDRLGLEALSDKALEASGRGLARMRLGEAEDALGGQLVIELVRARGPTSLPRHGLRVGAPVRLLGAERSAAVAAVVTRVGSTGLRVAVDPDAELPEGEIRVEPSPDEVTPRRIRSDLERAARATGRAAELRAVLLGETEARWGRAVGPASAFEDLDPTQAEAARHASSAKDVALVHGPPGTGKTRTLAAIIRAAVASGERVLALAPSHTAVDNLVLRLEGLDVVRLGHPARVLPGLERHTLSARLEAHEGVRLARKYLQQARQKFRLADRFTRAKPQPGEKAALRREAKELRADARRLERQAAVDLMDRAEVVLATLGFDPMDLGDRRFDLVVIDEAGQATEASAWRGVVRAERLVLGGDHLQLPPTVISSEALAAGYGVSLFERLMALDPELGRRLSRQYRMHALIMGFSSEALYDGALEADASVAGHHLGEIAGYDPLEGAPFTFVDTSGASFDEETGTDGYGRSNPREADVLVAEVERWLEAGLEPEAIGVITPYSAQAKLLDERLGGLGVEVDTVDGFQGREKEGILVSLVRSNPEGQIGFLSEHRRLNVALTRARRGLWVIGDGATVGADPFFSRLLAYAERVGGYRSVWERL